MKASAVAVLDMAFPPSVTIVTIILTWCAPRGVRGKMVYRMVEQMVVLRYTKVRCCERLPITAGLLFVRRNAVHL